MLNIEPFINVFFRALSLQVVLA